MSVSIPSEFAARLQSLLQQNPRQSDSGAGTAVPGVVLSGLVVVEHEGDQGQNKRGVVVDGKFVSVDLPDDVVSGDRVDVKVSSSAGETKLIFQGKTGQDLPLTDVRQRALDALLKTLDLNHESLSVLRTVLSAMPDAGGAKDGSHALPDSLIRFLKQSGVTDLLTPDRVRFELNNPTNDSTARAVKIITQVLSSRENALKGGPPARVKEILRQAISELEAFDLPQAAPQAEGEKIQVRQPVQGRRVEPEFREQIKQLAPAFDRILGLLREARQGKQAGSSAELEPFRQLVGSQLDQLKQVENKVSLLLRDLGGSGTLGDLVSALDSLRKMTEGQPDGISKMLNVFARDLLKGIQNALSQPEDFGMLRSVLKQGLEQLYQEFGLVPFEQRVFLPDSFTPPTIPHELRGLLRLLESQIVSLLADPDIEENVQKLLENNSQQLLTKIKIVQVHFGETLARLTESDLPATRPLQEKLQQTLTLFEKLVSPAAMRESGEAVSGRVLKETLSDLNHMVRQFSGFDFLPTQTSANFPVKAESDTIQKTLRQIERQLLNLLAFGEEAGPTVDSAATLERLIDLIADARQGSELRDPVGKILLPTQKLKLLLQQLMLELPTSGTPAEDHLAGAVYDLGIHLDQLTHSDARPAAATREMLQKSLTQFHRYLEQADKPEAIAPELSSVDSEALKRAGSVLAAQETLQRMAPVMKSLSEPILLLFPFVMGNFLSRAQCTFYPGAGRQDSERKPSGEASETFTRLKIIVPLPAFGRVLADVAYRSGEILINLGYENQQVADFVESKLLLLRKMLGSAGFHKIEISTAMATADALVGDHVDGESLRQVFQMSSLA